MARALKKLHDHPEPGSSQLVSVAEAKAHLSSLVTRVEKKRASITILRRGVPVAQLVPLTAKKPVSGYGWMRGTVQELGDIVGPTGVEWTVDDDDE